MIIEHLRAVLSGKFTEELLFEGEHLTLHWPGTIYSGCQDGEKMKRNPLYFNNPKVYTKLFYANSIKEIGASTKSRVIRIEDGGSYRYQSVDEHYIMSSKEFLLKNRNNSRKPMKENNFFIDNFLEADLGCLDKFYSNNS